MILIYEILPKKIIFYHSNIICSTTFKNPYKLFQIINKLYVEKISFTTHIEKVAVGEDTLPMIPSHQNFMSKIKIPTAENAKLSIGVQAIIGLDDSAQEDCVSLKGKVSFIPFIQSDSGHMVILKLTESINTDFKQEITFSEGMAGNIRFSNNSLLCLYDYFIS